MNSVTGINHVTFAVKELERSVAFYRGLLGFKLRRRTAGSAYLEAGTFWLALVEDTNVRLERLPEYTHLALSVPLAGLPVLKEKLLAIGVVQWQASERGNSFYFCDPDGHKLELHSGNLADRLADRLPETL